MRRIVSYLFVLAISAASSISAAADTTLTEEQAFIVLDHLMNLEPRDGEPEAALERYREWEDLYRTYWRLATSDDRKAQDVKTYLLLVFVAHESSGAATMEHIAETFLGFFEDNSSTILETLQQRRFLIPATCRAMRHSLQFSDLNNNSSIATMQFLDQYRSRIVEALDRRDMYKRCLAEIEQH